jgi:hypothetical protein
VNENHVMCGSEAWRALVRESILPWALGDVDLGDDVLEVGPGYGRLEAAGFDDVGVKTNPFGWAASARRA